MLALGLWKYVYIVYIICECAYLRIRHTVMVSAKRCPFCIVCALRTEPWRANQDKSIPKKREGWVFFLSFPVVFLSLALFMCATGCGTLKAGSSFLFFLLIFINTRVKKPPPNRHRAEFFGTVDMLASGATIATLLSNTPTFASPWIMSLFAFRGSSPNIRC